MQARKILKKQIFWKFRLINKFLKWFLAFKFKIGVFQSSINTVHKRKSKHSKDINTWCTNTHLRNSRNFEPSKSRNKERQLGEANRKAWNFVSTNDKVLFYKPTYFVLYSNKRSILLLSVMFMHWLKLKTHWLCEVQFLFSRACVKFMWKKPIVPCSKLSFF